MSNRLTTKEFIKKSTIIHGNKYDYSKTKYGKSNRDKVIIICKIHGEFLLRPNDHTSTLKRGCKKYSIEKRAKSQRLTQEDFEKKANAMHNNFYNYSSSIYKTYSDKIIINRPVHGNFKQVARDHLSGYGCYECGLNKCGYLSLEYIRNNKKIANIPTILYFVKGYSDTEIFYKVGITTHSFNRRFKPHEKYTFELIKEVKTTLLEAYMKEKQFKEDYFKFKYIPNYYFEGITECFKEEIYKELFQVNDIV